MAKLVVFPRKSNQKPKKGDSAPAETDAAISTQLVGTVMPIAGKAASKKVELVTLTAELKAATAYRSLRQERTNARLVGRRAKKAAEKAAAGEKEAAKGDKADE